MLKNWIRPEKPEGDELKQRLKAAQEKLDRLERRAREQGPRLEEALFQRCIGGDAPC